MPVTTFVHKLQLGAGGMKQILWLEKTLTQPNCFIILEKTINSVFLRRVRRLKFNRRI